MKREELEDYWQRSGYRGPDHPVVRAYALPKLDLVEAKLSLAGKSVLDVGCGPGIFTRLLAQRAQRVVGVDESPSMLERVEGIETVQADATSLPFDDSSFDVVFAANLLHHVEQPDRVVAELTRVAREAVAIIEPNRLNPVMFGFSLLVPAERGGLRSSAGFVRRLLQNSGLQVCGFWTTGMISQNNTPQFMLPFLRFFDFNFPFGEYHVAVGLKGDTP